MQHMAELHPQVHIIAGPNGAGKTTFARAYLPLYAGCVQFVNADLIASGLSPFAPETAAVTAGRLVLAQIRRLASQRVDFAFETTLSGRGYGPMLQRLKGQGFSICLYFLWLPTVLAAIERVANRVRHGGHGVPETDIRRRYQRSVQNFLHVYRSLADSWILMDNSGPSPKIIAIERVGNLSIIDQEAFHHLLEVAKSP
jgi:predicted ABC-type ATPase